MPKQLTLKHSYIKIILKFIHRQFSPNHQIIHGFIIINKYISPIIVISTIFVKKNMSDIIEQSSLYQQQLLSFHKLKQGLQRNEDFLVYNHNTSNQSVQQLKIITNESVGRHQLAITIILDKKTIKFRCQVYHNNEAMVIKAPEIRKLLYKVSLLKLQNPLKLVIEPDTGQVCIRYSTIINQQIGKKVFAKNISSAILLIEKYYAKIIGLFKQQIVSFALLTNSQIKYKKQSIQLNETIDVVKYFSKISAIPLALPHQINPHKKNDIIYCNSVNFYQTAQVYDWHTVTPEEQSKKLKFILGLCKPQNRSSFEPYKIFNFSSLQSGIEKIFKEKHHNNYLEPVLTEINVINYNETQWSLFKKGGFGCLYCSTIQFHYVGLTKQKQIAEQLDDQPITKPIILKIDDKKSVGKMFIEREIIKQIRNQSNKYLPRYYFCAEIAYKYALMIEYLPLKSLAEWLMVYGRYINLVKKLKICIDICHGLRFLHLNNIIHRDLKMTNILLDEALNPKICDFGESYHLEVHKKLMQTKLKVKQGFTLPYTPIEYFINKQSALTLPSYDIFSLGIILYEIIFTSIFLGDVGNEKIIQVIKSLGEKPEKHPQLIKKYKEFIMSKIQLSPQCLQNYGPPQIFYPIFNTIIRCLSIQPSQRPDIQWIILILKETSMNLLQFYRK